MYFGDGDGVTTFTLPHHHLGHFTRGTPHGVNHGDTQEDAIRNIKGKIDTNSDIFDEGSSGAFRNDSLDAEKDLLSSGFLRTVSGSVNFDASRVVPTANENRPHTANISIKIHRGWI